MLPSETLAKTEEVLISEGWTQYSDVDEKGEMCLAGALSYACGWRLHNDQNHLDGKVYSDSRQYIARVLDERRLQTPHRNDSNDRNDSNGYYLEAWNDTTERTFQEVLELLHEAQLLAKEEGQ